jgi:hypothetical protein
MMFKMQGKYVDSKLRSIGKEDKIKINGSEAPDFDKEDLRFGSGTAARPRAGSNYDSDLRSRRFGMALSDEQLKGGKTIQSGPSSFLASIQSSMGVVDDPFRTDT